MVAAFSDISKPTNDLLGRDFFHLAKAALDVKTKAPNGVTFAVKGKSSQKDSSISGNIEAKYVDKSSGLTLTQGWTTSNVLDTKIELNEALSPGLKSELVTSITPEGKRNARLNLFFANPNFNARGYFNLLKTPSFTGDVTVGHDGFLFGGEVGYDISSAKVTRYAAALGYSSPLYSTSITALNNFSVFSAGYFHKVTPLTEAGAKAVWDSKNPNVSIELASKHILDGGAFVKGKINNAGIATLAYQQSLRPGVKLGLGASVDALNLQAPVHQLGLSLSFAA